MCVSKIIGLFVLIFFISFGPELAQGGPVVNLEKSDILNNKLQDSLRNNRNENLLTLKKVIIETIEKIEGQLQLNTKNRIFDIADSIFSGYNDGTWNEDKNIEIISEELSKAVRKIFSNDRNDTIVEKIGTIEFEQLLLNKIKSNKHSLASKQALKFFIVDFLLRIRSDIHTDDNGNKLNTSIEKIINKYNFKRDLDKITKEVNKNAQYLFMTVDVLNDLKLFIKNDLNKEEFLLVAVDNIINTILIKYPNMPKLQTMLLQHYILHILLKNNFHFKGSRGINYYDISQQITEYTKLNFDKIFALDLISTNSRLDKLTMNFAHFEIHFLTNVSNSFKNFDKTGIIKHKDKRKLKEMFTDFIYEYNYYFFDLKITRAELKLYIASFLVSPKIGQPINFYDVENKISNWLLWKIGYFQLKQLFRMKDIRALLYRRDHSNIIKAYSFDQNLNTVKNSKETSESSNDVAITEATNTGSTITDGEDIISNKFGDDKNGNESPTTKKENVTTVASVSSTESSTHENANNEFVDTVPTKDASDPEKLKQPSSNNEGTIINENKKNETTTTPNTNSVTKPTKVNDDSDKEQQEAKTEVIKTEEIEPSGADSTDVKATTPSATEVTSTVTTPVNKLPNAEAKDGKNDLNSEKIKGTNATSTVEKLEESNSDSVVTDPNGGDAATQVKKEVESSSADSAIQKETTQSTIKENNNITASISETSNLATAEVESDLNNAHQSSPNEGTNATSTEEKVETSISDSGATDPNSNSSSKKDTEKEDKKEVEPSATDSTDDKATTPSATEATSTVTAPIEETPTVETEIVENDSNNTSQLSSNGESSTTEENKKSSSSDSVITDSNEGVVATQVKKEDESSNEEATSPTVTEAVSTVIALVDKSQTVETGEDKESNSASQVSSNGESNTTGENKKSSSSDSVITDSNNNDSIEGVAATQVKKEDESSGAVPTDTKATTPRTLEENDIFIPPVTELPTVASEEVESDLKQASESSPNGGTNATSTEEKVKAPNSDSVLTDPNEGDAATQVKEEIESSSAAPTDKKAITPSVISESVTESTPIVKPPTVAAEDDNKSNSASILLSNGATYRNGGDAAKHVKKEVESSSADPTDEKATTPSVTEATSTVTAPLEETPTVETEIVENDSNGAIASQFSSNEGTDTESIEKKKEISSSDSGTSDPNNNGSNGKDEAPKDQKEIEPSNEEATSPTVTEAASTVTEAASTVIALVDKSQTVETGEDKESNSASKISSNGAKNATLTEEKVETFISDSGATDSNGGDAAKQVKIEVESSSTDPTDEKATTPSVTEATSTVTAPVEETPTVETGIIENDSNGAIASQLSSNEGTDTESIENKKEISSSDSGTSDPNNNGSNGKDEAPKDQKEIELSNEEATASTVTEAVSTVIALVDKSQTVETGEDKESNSASQVSSNGELNTTGENKKSSSSDSVITDSNNNDSNEGVAATQVKKEDESSGAVPTDTKATTPRTLEENDIILPPVTELPTVASEEVESDLNQASESSPNGGTSATSTEGKTTFNPDSGVTDPNHSSSNAGTSSADVLKQDASSGTDPADEESPTPSVFEKDDADKPAVTETLTIESDKVETDLNRDSKSSSNEESNALLPSEKKETSNSDSGTTETTLTTIVEPVSVTPNKENTNTNSASGASKVENDLEMAQQGSLNEDTTTTTTTVKTVTEQVVSVDDLNNAQTSKEVEKIIPEVIKKEETSSDIPDVSVAQPLANKKKDESVDTLPLVTDSSITAETSNSTNTDSVKDRIKAKVTNSNVTPFKQITPTRIPRFIIQKISGKEFSATVLINGTFPLLNSTKNWPFTNSTLQMHQIDLNITQTNGA